MQAVRVVAAVIGAALALTSLASVLRSLVIPRGRAGPLLRGTDKAVHAFFQLVTKHSAGYEQRDRILAAQAPAFLGAVLGVWLAGFLVGFALLIWPWTRHFLSAFRESGSSLLTLGFATTPRVGPTVIDLLAAMFGLATVALQIGYLPTLYSAFNRRETEVTLLGARAGSPPWGPELLARTRVGLQGEGGLEALYSQWERWAADIAESHSNYPALVRFRSPQPYAHWLVALLAVLDSAAMFHALSPEAAPLSGRLVLRMGFTSMRQISASIGMPFDPDPRPDDPIQLTEEEFRGAVARLEAVGFPIERDAAQAWAHFRGWRVNYEQIAYDLCYALDAVPALWSGPRRRDREPIAPIRPPVRTPEQPDGAPTAYRIATDRLGRTQQRTRAARDGTDGQSREDSTAS